MKPNPFFESNHLTVPVGMTVLPDSGPRMCSRAAARYAPLSRAPGEHRPVPNPGHGGSTLADVSVTLLNRFTRARERRTRARSRGRAVGRRTAARALGRIGRLLRLNSDVGRSEWAPRPSGGPFRRGQG